MVIVQDVNLITVERVGWNVIPASIVATIEQPAFEPDSVQLSADDLSEMRASDASDITSPAASESAVQAFIRRRELPADDLRRVLKIVYDCFELADRPTLTIEEDADTDERWLEIAVVARGTPEQIISARRAYMRSVRSSTSPKIQQHVRLALVASES